MLTNILYFNLSDFLNQTDLHNFYTYDRLIDVEYVQKLGGFFFNIKNITKHEIENFIIFFRGDISMLENSNFIKNLIYFFSLFYNQALILYFMNLISIIELYHIFSLKMVSKSQINILMTFFNKRIILEVYRFFLTFSSKYLKISFSKFKNFILSETFFFDSNKFLYHYYYFLDSELEGFYMYYYYLDQFLDNVFMGRLSFLEVLEYLLDYLITNLYFIMQIYKNLQYSFGNYSNQLFYLSKNKLFNFEKNKSNLTLGIFKLKQFVINFFSYFTVLHDCFSLFRIYLYLYQVLIFKKSNYKILFKFFKLFQFDFFKLVSFYKTFLPESDLSFIYKLYFEFKLVFFKFFFKKDLNFFKTVYYYYYYLFYKFFNYFKLMLLYNNAFFNFNNVFLRYNSFVYLNFLKKTNFVVNNDFLRMFSQFSLLFDYIPLNSFVLGEKFYSFDFFMQILNNQNFSFFIKKNIYLNIIKSNFNFILPVAYFFRFLTLFLTKRTLLNYNITNISYNPFTFFFSIKFFSYKIYLKYYNIISSMSYISLFNILLNFYHSFGIYFFVPFSFRIKTEIEDFFFLLHEEVFAEDFNYFLDDIIFFDKEESDTYDAEDDTDYLDNFFDETEIYSIYTFVYLENIASVNYYAYDILGIKYTDLNFSTLAFNSFGDSFIYDFEFSKIAPYLNKLLFLNTFSSTNEINEFDKTINPLGWYNWVCFALFSDLNSFDINFFNQLPEVRFFNSKFLNYVFYGGAANRKKLDYLNYDTIDEPELLNDKSVRFDSNIFSMYSSFDEKVDRIIYNVYDDPDSDFDEHLIRDLVVLNDNWIWWEYINNIIKLSNNYGSYFKSKIKPLNAYELYFLNTYILSGLPILIDNILKKAPLEEKSSRFAVINSLINELYHNEGIDQLNIDLVYNNNDINLVSYKNFEMFYNNWLNLYSSLIFLNDYSDFVQNLICFNDAIGFDFDLDYENFVFLRKLEKFYYSFLKNTFKFSLLSFYNYNNKSSLIMFWEHFYLNVIEVIYSLVNINFVHYYANRLNDFFYYDEKVDPERATLYKSIDYLSSNMQISDNELVPDYLQLYLSQINNPYYLLFNGLDVTVSLAEILFFDLYESYVEVQTDTDQDEFDSNSLNIFKFFDFDDGDLRDSNDDEVAHILQTKLQFEYFNLSFEYVEEKLGHVSLQFSNFFIGEGYDFYLKRYYSINKLNFFLYGLLTNYLEKYSISNINFTQNLGKNNVSLFNNSRFYIDIILYKLELIYYYIITLFFINVKKNIKNFNLFIFFAFYYLFINTIKRLNFSVNYQIFIILIFSSYYLYKFYFLLKKNNMSFFDFLKLSISEFFKFFKWFYIFVIKFVLFLIKAYIYIYFRHLMYRKYNNLFKFFLSNSIYKKFFGLFKMNFSFVNFTKKNYFKFLEQSTFRSFISTLPLYSYIDKTKLNLFFDQQELSNYVSGNNNRVRTSAIINSFDLNLKFQSYGLNFYNYFFENSISSFNNIGNIELEFLDNYDILKESFYHDYEDYLDDEEFYTDEWTADFTVGDLSDDYEEDTFENSEALDYNKEELNFELDLDSSFLHMVHEDDWLGNIHKYQDKTFLWQNRFHYFMNTLYYYNLTHIRNFFLKLIKYYKIKVPMLTAANLDESFVYYSPKNEELLIDYNKFNFANSIQMRDFSFTKLRTLYKNSTFNVLEADNSNVYLKLLPKYFYTYDLIDILDYFIDFNNIELSEFNSVYDFSDILLGINTKIETDFLKKDISLNNIFIRLMSFYKYVYLYLYIFQYIDNVDSSKLLFYCFFFFDLFSFFKKFLLYFQKKYIKINYKFVFNKIYMFFFKNLYTFYHLNNSEFSALLNYYKTYKFIPFFSFNYKNILNKISILKAFYSTELSLLSYLFFVRSLDFLKTFNLSKKKFYVFFFKIKKYLKLYETFIYLNAYKLAQIYSKYGSIECLFFFENLIIKNLFIEQHKYYLTSYKMLYKLLFFYEIFIFILVVCVSLIFLVQIPINIFMAFSFWPRFYRMREDGFHVMLISYNRHIFENKLSYLINKTWLDLWGVF